MVSEVFIFAFRTSIRRRNFVSNERIFVIYKKVKLRFYKKKIVYLLGEWRRFGDGERFGCRLGGIGDFRPPLWSLLCRLRLAFGDSERLEPELLLPERDEL